MKGFSHNKIIIAMLSLGLASSVFAQDGINDTTGYASNYTVTGNEMTMDFANIDWHVVKVNSASELKKALSNAKAGDKIVIAAGTYTGFFKLTKGGSQERPIWIVGEDSKNMPILNGDDYNNKIVLSINGTSNKPEEGISYIYIQDIEVMNGRTGIALDQADYVTIDNVTVHEVGQAGIHLRDGSSYNIVKNSTVYNTGLYNVKYGEAVYIGSDYTKWDGTGKSSRTYDPAVNYNQILTNTLGPNVTAEHIDVKEGSSYSYIIGNTFNAAGMIDILNGGLSYIDFKGNYTEAAYNTGNQNGNKYFDNAFEINEKSEGWGYHNNIHDNVLTFNDEYYRATKEPETLTIALGSKGKPQSKESTKSLFRTHWVVKNNVKDSNATNVVSSNIRTPVDSNKMYVGKLTER
ncbi:right-handed parallel beta-helix repeat-containing protein [Psychromonas sp. PT13]|uniref:right-handed parallel beta-helix repeat-containing protein n=1 Tax=Psychromonas sp. PT13 TaxID=3439547 RepID=UPI003EBBD1C1